MNVTAEANKKLRRQFDLDKKLLFELRRQVDGKAEKKEDTDILVAEVDKQLKTWTWDTEKIPEIKKVRTKTRKETYSVTITINKKTRVYRRQDPKLLEEMRDKVLKAGKHIKFPRPVRKGKDAPAWKTN